MSRLQLIKPKSFMIEIEGKEYEMSLTMSSFAKIEEKYGNIEKALAELQQTQSVSLLAFCICACFNGAFTEDEFSKKVDVNSIRQLADVFKELLDDAMPAEVATGKEGKN